ncbi:MULTISPECIES: hypothetical protein [unclassified Bartonella]|uniref:hypothetical protein n=1 Tax=unclassified Bartonella TaxID=2645622 RepID=UPI00300E3684
MFKLTLRLFFSFLFVIYVQLTTAKETNDNFVLSPISNQNIIANYPLTENLLSKIEQIQKEIENLPSALEIPNTGNDNSIEGLIASVSSQSKLSNILRKNNLTPKDYVIGLMTLQATLAAIIALEDKKIFSDEKNIVSPNNLKFGQKNINRIRAILDH